MSTFSFIFVDNSKNWIYYHGMFMSRRKFDQLQATIENQNAVIQNLQVSIGQLARESQYNQDPLKYSENRFTQYESWIDNIHKVCAGKDSFGLTVVSLLYKRAGFIAGTVETKLFDPTREWEKAFITEFLKYNNLQEAGLIEQIADIDKEGKVLFYLTKDKKHKWQWKTKAGEVKKQTGMINVKYLPYGRYKYKIIPYANDENKPENATYEVGDTKKPVVFEENQFVYSHYRGGVSTGENDSGDINTAMSPFWICWESIVGYEKALADMRNNNHLFASPKPYIKCETTQAAKETDALVNSTTGGVNWQTRKIMILVGEPGYLTPTSNPLLDAEIKAHIQAISLATGIPPHQLGRDDEARTKAVGTNMMEGLGASIIVDRAKAVGWLNELKTKAMNMMNGELTPLDPNVIELTIGGVTQEDWDRLVTFYLAARNDGHISRETFLEQIPDLDVEKELKRQEEDKKKEEKEKQARQDEFFKKMVDNNRAEEIEGKQNQNQQEDNENGETIDKGGFRKKIE